MAASASTACGEVRAARLACSRLAFRGGWRARPPSASPLLPPARPSASHAPRPSVQLKKYFTFEVQVLDDKNVRRRFRASNYQSTTRVKPFICTMPMRLDEGWNQIQVHPCPCCPTPPPPLARHLTARVPSRGSSTCQTSHGARTAPTTSRRCACRSTPTAASAGSTFRTGATAEPRTPRSRTAVEPHASRSTRAPAPAPFASVTASFALPNPQPWHVRDASSAQALLRGGAAAGVQALPANPGVARSPERLLRPGARSHASPPLLLPAQKQAAAQQEQGQAAPQ